MAGLLDFIAKSGQWLGRKSADLYEKMSPQAGGEGGVPLRQQAGTPPLLPADAASQARLRGPDPRAGMLDGLPRVAPPPINRPGPATGALGTLDPPNPAPPPADPPPALKFAEPNTAAGILPPSAPPGAARPTLAGVTSKYEDFVRQNAARGPIMNAPEPTFAEPAKRWGDYREDDPRFGGSWQNKGWKRTLLGAGLGFLQGFGATGSVGGGIGGAITGGIGSAASPDAAKNLYANAWLRPQEDAEMQREYQRQRLGLDLKKDQLGVQEAEARIGKTEADTARIRDEILRPDEEIVQGTNDQYARNRRTGQLRPLGIGANRAPQRPQAPIRVGPGDALVRPGEEKPFYTHPGRPEKEPQMTPAQVEAAARQQRLDAQTLLNKFNQAKAALIEAEMKAKTGDPNNQGDAEAWNEAEGLRATVESLQQQMAEYDNIEQGGKGSAAYAKLRQDRARRPTPSGGNASVTPRRVSDLMHLVNP